MANQTISDLFEKSSAYDSKHINNLSTKKVPQSLLDAVIDGCSIETLQKLAKGFPICKYKTQITVHGIFQEPRTNYTCQYKTLTKNKNNSLGIRWVAIDHDKKAELFSLIKTGDKDWFSVEDSQGYFLRKMKRVSIDEYKEVLAQFKQKAESINTSLFTGFCSAYVMKSWGSVFIVLDLNIQCFPVKNRDLIAQNVLDQDIESIKAAREAELARRAAEEAAEKEKERLEEIERQKAREEKQNRYNTWKEQNPIPSDFKLVSDYTFKPGDIELFAVDSSGDVFNYRYRIYSKSFGRLIVTVCDKNGNKIARKGTEAIFTSRKQTYIKSAS